MNRSVLSRLIPIFIAASVVMHCLPVQRCAVELIAFGSSCHDDSSRTNDVGIGSITAPEQSFDRASADTHSHGACICEAPNAPADRGTVHSAVAVDLGDFSAVERILVASSVGSFIPCPSEPPSAFPPVGFVLPLLL